MEAFRFAIISYFTAVWKVTEVLDEVRAELRR
jgi:hypothetical protein